MENSEQSNLIRVDFARRAVIGRAAPERAEAMALDYLAELRMGLEAGAVDGSLGPLLALSLLDVAGGLAGSDVVELVAGVVRGLAQGGQAGPAAEVARGAATGFIRAGDHQAGADMLELANSCGRFALSRRT
jgi:hypothetical protein